MKNLFLLMALYGLSILTLSAQEDTTRTEQVNIKVFKNSRSERALVNDIRSAGIVMSGISSERIGALQLSSANDVVRKITGVTVMDDGKLVIRGVSPRYNVVLMNGFKAPSFDPDVRLFSLDILPANVLDNVKVIKSPSAEYPSDFSGGIVNIETLSLPNKSEWRGQFTLGADLQTMGRDYMTQTQSESKRLGFNKSSNALPFAVSVDHMDRSVFTVAERINITQSLPYNFYPELITQSTPNWKFQIMKSNRLKLKSGKSFFGTSHLLSLENTYESRTFRRSSIMTNPFLARILNFSDETFIQNIRTTALNNFTYGNEGGLRIDLKTLYVNNAEYGVLYRQGKALPGAYGENGVYENVAFKQYTTNNTFRDFFIASTNIKLPLRNDKFDWSMGGNLSLSNFKDQDRKSALRTRDDNPTGSTTTFNFVEDNVATMDQLRFGRWFYQLPEQLVQAKSDLGYRLNKQIEFKLGYRYDLTSREFDLRSMGMVRKIWKDTVQEFSGQLLDEYTWPYNSYKAKYSTAAVYLMANYKSHGLNLNGGVRLEKTVFDLYSDGFERNFNTKSLKRSSVNLFPSLNATYELSKGNLIRGALGYTSNRPELREYSPLEYLDVRNWLSAYGNGGLKPVSVILNGELRLEHYNKGGYRHIGIFYKRMNDPVVAKAQGSNSYSFVNIHHALVYGSEFEYSRRIDFSKLSVIQNIEIIGNVSLNFSEMFENFGNDLKDSVVRLGQPMVGQSPYLANIQITGNFKKDKGNITLSCFYQGDRTVFAGDDRFLFSLRQRTGVLMNITTCYNFSKKSQLRFKIDNILNVSDILYNDLNANRRLDYYDGYIVNITGDNIFSHRRDPAVISIGWLYRI